YAQVYDSLTSHGLFNCEEAAGHFTTRRQYFDPNPSGKNVKLVMTEVEAIEYKLISLITKNSG
ncbi:MAG: hypothetical protein VYE61_03090, partial [Pseudomonadota bacterium]|nr:hypothetical protein [Pseudomonadota bacterium]